MQVFISFFYDTDEDKIGWIQTTKIESTNDKHLATPRQAPDKSGESAPFLWQKAGGETQWVLRPADTNLTDKEFPLDGPGGMSVRELAGKIADAFRVRKL